MPTLSLVAAAMIVSVLGVALASAGCVAPELREIREESELRCSRFDVDRAVPAEQPKPPSVTPPVLRTRVDAIYPPSALASRARGDVVLVVTVDAEGRVVKTEVDKTSGDAGLDEAAVAAARQWTFAPALRDGRPVRCRILARFHFDAPVEI
jgi:TonB family protein